MARGAAIKQPMRRLVYRVIDQMHHDIMRALATFSGNDCLLIIAERTHVVLDTMSRLKLLTVCKLRIFRDTSLVTSEGGTTNPSF